MLKYADKVSGREQYTKEQINVSPFVTDAIGNKSRSWGFLASLEVCR